MSKQPSPTEPADGDCFVVAYRLLVDADDERQRLCHGTVVRHTDDLHHTHAWVESTHTYDVPFAEDTSRTMPIQHTQAFDYANGNNVEMPAALYRKIGKAHDVVEYTRVEAMRLAVESGHYGPWHPDPQPWDELPVSIRTTIPRWILAQARAEWGDMTLRAEDVVAGWIENMEANAYDQARENGTLLPDLTLGERASCVTCGMDIEWDGDHWRGRGSERTCVESGAVRRRDPHTGEPIDWPADWEHSAVEVAR